MQQVEDDLHTERGKSAHLESQVETLQISQLGIQGCIL